jgi:IclR family transcriptional regulator, acetate operon repressor
MFRFSKQAAMSSLSPFDKALLILQAVAERASPTTGVRELAVDLGLSPATVHRTLGGLLKAGMIVRDDAQGRYGLGPGALRLGLALASRAPWRAICLPHIRALAASCGEAVAFAIVDRARLQMMTIARTQSRHAVTVVEADGWKALHAGAGGLAILAFLPQADQTDALAIGRLKRETGATIVDPGALRRELAAIVQRGYAQTHGQRIAGAVAVGAPVFSMGDDVLGSVYVSIPEQRFNAELASEIAPLVMSTARALTRDLASPPSASARRRRKSSVEPRASG